MLETYEQNSKKKLAATIVAILVIAGSTVFADHLKTKSPTSSTTASQTSSATTTTAASTPSTPTTSSASTSSAAPAAAPTSSGYKDGSYTASSSYYVPHGNENIQVSLTVSGGVITSASIQNSEGDNQSAQYQEGFASEYKSYVVGKKISGLQLSVIAGASDTTQGFNDALSQIASKAQA